MVLGVKAISHDRKQGNKTEKHHTDHLVLLAEVGHRPAAHSGSNVPHTFVALWHTQHPTVEEPRKSQGRHSCDRNWPKKQSIHSFFHL